MESFAPFPAPQERAPDLEPSKQKPRWNLFEMFKKRDDALDLERAIVPNGQELLPAGKQGEAAAPPERRRFAATVISLLRGESAQHPVAPEPAFTGEAVLTAERVTRPGLPVAAAEFMPLPEQLPFVERAKEMGRGVLRMVTRAREEVAEADRREHFTNPTNLEPLAVADADVRAAMEELIAPIEALQKPAAAAGDTIETAVRTGGDRDPAMLFEPKTPLARTLEVAAAVASVTAREVLHAKERALARTGIVHKVGLFALGAATVGGFVYTWNRMRDIKKGQREMRREHKRFEAEVRAGQEREERRLHKLEGTDVQLLTPPERRHYVEQVSEFAHRQAAEIRTAARTRDIVYQPEPVLGAAGKPDDTAKKPQGQAQPQVAHPRRQSSHAWLWGFMLGVAVVIFIVLWGLRIL